MSKRKQWWYTDGDGRSIGYIWPEDFQALLESYYGKGWIAAFAEEAGISVPTVYRYLNGQQPIPKTIMLIVSMLGTLSSNDLTPEVFVADWLPGVEIEPAMDELQATG